MSSGGIRGKQVGAGLICGSCFASLVSASNFCSECGARLAQTARRAEYKQVTVLVTDVVRSMELASTLDLERLREIMTQVVERSAGVARRYGGTVEYHGDGVMAIFGAPTALEDHALRACVAALEIQHDMKLLSAEVRRRDRVALQVRVGLNSGRVIAGDLGAGSLGYRATGRHVGMAQRIESVAPPGAVMLSESTVRLVEQVVTLTEPEWVDIKGFAEPVRAWRLLAIGNSQGATGRTEAALVGRRGEMAVLNDMVERAIGRRGVVVNVTGPPGIGKSRAARDVAAVAAARGVDVFWAFCESHASDVPFYAVTRLLRAALRLTDVDSEVARARLRIEMPAADPEDLLLLDDLLGIADPHVPVPQINPDTRRRRLTALINTASIGRSRPALYIVEDVHWIDGVSESMLSDFLTVIPRTASMVLITHRPEYHGVLARAEHCEAVPLGPLHHSEVTDMLSDLLGTDPSVGGLALVIADRAAGNPFFAEEMVRELVQRGVLEGEAGDYSCTAEVSEVTVPATVQAAIEARIDSQTAAGKRTIRAASVIGAQFTAELFVALDVQPVFDELIGAELIDRVESASDDEYVFRHPLIRAVAYESQLKSDRAEWHRRFAAGIQQRAPGSTEENAALIAEHLESAGELIDAFGWHMRAGTWLANRDLAAARVSWERARRIADQLPADDDGTLTMRISPRTMLCATDIQAREAHESVQRFAELRQLCHAAGDTVSLAIGMSGPATALLYAGRVREASALSIEQMALLASIDDPAPIMGLASIAFCNWLGIMDFERILQWSQIVVDMADGDPVKGAGYGVGSPLAIALAWRGTARWCLRRTGWHSDLHEAVAMARCSNAETLSGAIAWTYGIAMQYGALEADEFLMRTSEEAVQIAQSASNDRAMGLAGYTLAVTLLNQEDGADRRRGLKLMRETREIWLRRKIHFLLPVTDVWVARETASKGDLEAAITAMRQAVGDLQTSYPFYCVWATGVFVQTLLERHSQGDMAEAERAVAWLADLATEQDSAMIEISVLRLQALLAGARDDKLTFADHVRSYRDRAESLDLKGHIAWSQTMGVGH
ncbi:ATP-binding protein [Mycolicibacterium iranicum]|uniref:Cyclase n=1 Tax=Mycolicibacterium iranicum TaxID=912594 RepID=A0A178LUV3_MYCIR|nr:adenylate/guanylate cyclase domain-containing protein [Mycolicibacterium iranicum]OAN37857.1 cyclase [Mycolicibacterium iranicum]